MKKQEGRAIQVRGAHENNLRHISCEIPRNSLVLVSGPSGSGKSSLVFDTIYAEAERRLSLPFSSGRQARARPKVDSIRGLSFVSAPAYSWEHRALQLKSEDSDLETVGQISALWEALAALFFFGADRTCQHCRAKIITHTRREILYFVRRSEVSTQKFICVPLGQVGPRDWSAARAKIEQEGFSRVFIGGNLCRISEIDDDDIAAAPQVDLVIDLVNAETSGDGRVLEAIDVALQRGAGELVLRHADDRWHGTVLPKCLNCGDIQREIRLSDLYFKSKEGKCATCHGRGVTSTFTEESLVSSPEKSLAKGAIPLLGQRVLAGHDIQEWIRIAGEKDASALLDKPWRELNREWRNKFLFGKLADVLSALSQSKISVSSRRAIESVLVKVECLDCRGSRFAPEVRSLTLGGLRLAEVLSLPLGHLASWLEQRELRQELEESAQIGVELSRRLKEAQGHVRFLNTLGLEYLNVGRPTSTLSHGELNRLFLCRQLAADISGALYLFDEPTDGLHPRDIEQLVLGLKELVAGDSSVLAIDHDPYLISQADYLIELGPGAGTKGGEIVFAGPPQNAGRRSGVIAPAGPAHVRSDDRIVLSGVTKNNLQCIEVEFPLRTLIGVAGVSGSGKSSLVVETLLPALRARLLGNAPPAVALSGGDSIQGVVALGDRSEYRSARSIVASAVGILAEVRELYASTVTAQAFGYTARHFSFFSRSTRCRSCGGRGTKRLGIVCEECRGGRLPRFLQEVKFQGVSIQEFLHLSVSEVCERFAMLPFVRRKLQPLQNLGLGYLLLDQSAALLSRGEKQRLNLARMIGVRRLENGGILFVFDEPTSGLYQEEVAILLRVLVDLVEKGNSVIVIEHNAQLLREMSYLVELGPGAGPAGGRLIASGTPAELRENPSSLIGRYL